MAIRIEDATKDDVPRILEFIHMLAEYEEGLDRVSATEELLRTSLFSEKPFARALLAYENNEPVAYAIYFFNYSSFSAMPGLYLEDIFVRPESRGTGVGRQLMAFLAQRALESGCEHMEWAVLNWNESAMRFYETLGAEPKSEWTVFSLKQEKVRQLAKDHPV